MALKITAVFLVLLLFYHFSMPSGAANQSGIDPEAMPRPSETPVPMSSTSPQPQEVQEGSAIPSPTPETTPAQELPAEPPSPSETPLEENAPVEEAAPPRVTAVLIEGNSAVSTEDILKVLYVKVGDPYLEPKLNRDIRAIYETGCFTDVRIDSAPHAGGVKVTFRVIENPVVTEIQISGNSIVDTETLKNLLGTKTGKILNKTVLSDDISAINSYYNDNLGYVMKTSHVVGIDFSPEGKLSLTIQDGVEVKDVKIEGSSLYSDAVLRRMVRVKAGDLFNKKAMQTDYDTLNKYYEENDYVLNTIRGNIDDDGVVTVQIVEASVEDIRVEGNTKTRTYVIMRNLRTRVGQVIRKKKIKRDMERLNNLGYFETVNMDVEPGSSPGKVVLAWKVKEQKTGLATLGLGYSGGGAGALQPGLTGAISYSEKNLGGKGQTASAQWQRGVNIDSLSLSFYDPAINKLQDSLGFSFYNSAFQELRQPVYGLPNLQYAYYNDKRAGGSVTYGKLLTDDLRLFLTVKHEELRIEQSADSQYQVTGVTNGTQTVNSSALAAIFDTRDDVFNPYEGNYLNASVELAGGLLKGDFDYTKSILEWRKYFPLRHEKTLAFRAWGGNISGSAPITENFYVGGTDTLRGYPDNSFYGTSMVVLNLEFRFPIADIKMLKGAVFVDAGNAWMPGQKDITLKKDVGVGLRIVFPTLGLGVIRVDYAYGEQDKRFSIGIGQTF
jgi:outer membrane protein insertion porin family